MIRRNLLKIASLFFLLPAPAAMAAEPVYLLDFVVLQDSATLTQRDAYEAKVAEIAARYDVLQIHSYNTAAKLSGKLDGVARVNVFEMPDMAALQSITGDADYAALEDMRNTVHDMSALTLYTGTKIFDHGPITDGNVLVDLVVMSAGHDATARAAYADQIAPLAAKYGATLKARYQVGQKLSGKGPDNPILLNIWHLADPAGIGALSQDPAYQALEEERQHIHDMAALGLWMAAPRP